MVRAMTLLISHPWQHLWHMLLMSVLLTIQFGVLLVYCQSEPWLRQQLPEPKLVIFMRAHASETQIHGVWSRLATQTSVKSFDTRSPQEALAQLQAIPPLAPVLAQLEHNPLGVTYIIHFHQPNAYHFTELEQDLSALPGVASVHSDRSWAEHLNQLSRFIRLLCLLIGIPAGLTWLTLSVGLSRHLSWIHATDRRIMWQLGASPRYLARPYGYAGLLFGTLCSGLALLPLWLLGRLVPQLSTLSLVSPFLLMVCGSTSLISGFLFFLGQRNSGRR